MAHTNPFHPFGLEGLPPLRIKRGSSDLLLLIEYGPPFFAPFPVWITKCLSYYEYHMLKKLKTGPARFPRVSVKTF
jgi:hypothetical protein